MHYDAPNHAPFMNKRHRTSIRNLSLINATEPPPGDPRHRIKWPARGLERNGQTVVQDRLALAAEREQVSLLTRKDPGFADLVSAF